MRAAQVVHGLAARRELSVRATSCFISHSPLSPPSLPDSSSVKIRFFC